jgi:hypothetical protein
MIMCRPYYNAVVAIVSVSVVFVHYALFSSISIWLLTEGGLPSYVFSGILFLALCATSTYTAWNNNDVGYKNRMKMMSVICWIVYAIATVNFVLNSVVLHLVWTSITGIYWVTLTSIVYTNMHKDTQSSCPYRIFVIAMCFVPFVISYFILEFNLVFVYFMQTIALIECLLVILYCVCFKTNIENDYRQWSSLTSCFVLWLSGILLVNISVIYILWEGAYSHKMAGIHSLCFALSVLSVPSAIDAHV